MTLRLILLCTATSACLIAKAQRPPEVLVFSRTTGYRHTAIPAGVEAVRTLGEEYGWTSHWTEDGAEFTDEKLAPYAAVVFMSTTMDVLDSAQQAAFERYIQSGRGYVGVHAAADTEYDWPWYRGLVGRQFIAHPDHQRATLHVEPNDFGGMAGFGDSLTLFEEWYEYTGENADGLHYLLSVDEGSYGATPTYKNSPGMGDFHPIAWWHAYDGGRAFYTGIGHMDSTYLLPAFRTHLAAGISYAISGDKTEPMSTPMLGLRTVTYEVPDLAAAKTWYAGAFATEPYFDEPHYAGFDIGGFELGLMPEETPVAASAKTDNAIVYWRVEDIDVQFARLLAAGAKAHREPASVGEDIETGSVVDPYGNVIGLISVP